MLDSNFPQEQLGRSGEETKGDEPVGVIVSALGLLTTVECLVRRDAVVSIVRWPLKRFATTDQSIKNKIGRRRSC